ncbi:MAG: SGNH/GDSL hydrolase family protein, partial [Chitinophagaceae bacterium]|nr:SGNH/GDSL hydrolase family protein [Chitinophagaceae bacterium]
ATVLMPYLNKYPVFDSTIAKAGITELWKIKASKIYAYNSKLGSAFQNAYTNVGHSSDMGYEPLYKTIDTAVYKESIWKDIDKDLPLSEDYISTLTSIIQQAKTNDVQLVLCISPFYFHHNFSANSSYNRIKKTAADYNIPLLDFTNDPEFTGQPLLFNDDVHLNDSGAGIYTSKVAAILLAKGIINNNK